MAGMGFATYLGKVTHSCTAGVAMLALSYLMFGIPERLTTRNWIAVILTVMHIPYMKRRARHFMIAAWVCYLLTVYEVLQMAWIGCVLCSVMMANAALRRLYSLFQTFRCCQKATIFFPYISRIVPAFHYSYDQFFCADECPPEVANRRKAAFYALEEKWQTKYAKPLEIADSLKGSFSDLRFTAGNRCFPPFAEILNLHLEPFIAVTHTAQMELTDVDGHTSLDIAGSCGVNVVGYDRYKKFMQDGMKTCKELGCVLGPVHPILAENIQMLKAISGMQEVSMHVSGTEAVMCAVRLARFNTGKSKIVQFAGAYHGWWNGVQPLAGDERLPHDVLALTEDCSISLSVIRLRRDEIAAVVVNPLQGFHPNSPPPSDMMLISNSRKADIKNSYKIWLEKLRQTCSKAGVVLIFDEVYTGFRLAPRGAQEYFGIQADMVCYGKTLGGGFANGAVCGPSWLMKRSQDNRPMRVAYAIGTFSAHPVLVGWTNSFLNWATSKKAADEYASFHNRVANWVQTTNKRLAAEKVPLAVTSYASVCAILYQRPSRYHWMLQYYLRDEGIVLSSVGTGRLNFSLDFTDTQLEQTCDGIVQAGKRMQEDGWWVDRKLLASNWRISISLAKSFGWAMLRQLWDNPQCPHKLGQRLDG